MPKRGSPRSRNDPLTRGLGFLGLHRTPMFDFFFLSWTLKLLNVFHEYFYFFQIHVPTSPPKFLMLSTGK